MICLQCIFHVTSNALAIKWFNKKKLRKTAEQSRAITSINVVEIVVSFRFVVLTKCIR